MWPATLSRPDERFDSSQVDRFRGTTAAQLEEYRLLERRLREQCHVGKHRDGRPGDDDDDAGECKVPVA